MGVSLNKLLRATVVHIVMLILLCLSCSHALDVETHTEDKTNHSKGQNFAASCSIEIHGEELEEIIDSDGEMQLGVKMLDCKSNFFVLNAMRTVPGNLHQCLNIPAQNISCRFLTNGNRLYMLTWVVIPGNYLSKVQNYSFSCHDINNLAVPRNCPARAFHVSVVEQTTTEVPSHPRGSRDVRSHSLRYTRNGAGRIMWHPFTLSELLLCVMLVELLTRR